MTVLSISACAAALAPSEPVVFDGFTGIFQRAAVPAGAPVLMFSPFGYEELCARGFWTALADRFATAGFESLRFDFPGTANALDTTAEGLDDWLSAARSAAGGLRHRTGRSAITLLGLGLGATLAASWASELGPLASLVLLEPAHTGRGFSRAMTAWGAAIASASGLATADARPGSPPSVAGFVLPDRRVAAVRRLDLATAPVAAVSAVLVVEQTGGQAGKTVARRFGAAGACVDQQAFPGYAALMNDPTSAQMPERVMAAVVTWLAGQPLVEDGGSPAQVTALAGSTVLAGDGFTEQPIRFGPDRRLAGVLCLPTTADRRGRAVVLANAGRDFSIGWARSAVAQARALASNGVASLRFDLGGIGDSRAAPDAPREILYSAAMCADLRLGVDHLHDLGFRKLGVVGRCSGAWAAFTLAGEDTRVESLVLVNTLAFLWDPTKDLADVMRFSQRSVGDLGATLLKRGGLRRLLRGDLDLRGGGRFLLRQANRHFLRPSAPALGPLTTESRRFHRLHSLFRRLMAREARVLLVYAEGDASLGELRSFMGRDLARLRRYPNVAVLTVADADHNFTPEAARQALTAHITAFLDPVAEHRAMVAASSQADGYPLLASSAPIRPRRFRFH